MKRIADYDVVEQLRPGNHGTFFVAEPPARLGLDAELVALKVLDRHATDNELKRMGAELKVLLAIDHPYLVDVLDAGHDDGRLFYATPYFSEGSLGAGPCSLDEVTRIASQVADAAEAAHALHQIGVAHRDIKPSNVLLAAGRGHLSDLGVANYAEAQFTTTGSSPVGTLTYADPELISGQLPGRASDIWSLGATLHMAVTGQSVIGTIPNAHLAAAIEYVLEAEAVIAPGCRPEIAAVVARATQRHRGDRYLTALEMADDLRAIAGQEPTPIDAPTPDGPAPGATGPTLLPVAAPRSANVTAPLHQHPVFVVGQRSVAGYLNHPEARRCRLSGEQRDAFGPWVPERGHRPPLGILVGDDGRSHLVHWDLVIGRQPGQDEAVAAGQAVGVHYETELTMSRVHLRIELREWDVTITDQSSNGTSVRRAGQAEAVALSPGEPTALGHGDVIVIEGRTLTFHSFFASVSVTR